MEKSNCLVSSPELPNIESLKNMNSEKELINAQRPTVQTLQEIKLDVNNQNTQNVSQPEPKSLGLLKPLTFCQHFRKNTGQSKHIFILSMVVTMSFYSIFYTFPVLIGTGLTQENLNDPNYNEDREVDNAKFWVFFSLISEFASYILVPIFKLNQSPRSCLLKGMALYILTPIFVALGYWFDSLPLVRMSNIFHGFGIGMIFGGFNAYYIQILHPQLTGIPNFSLSLFNSLLNLIFPLVFKEGVSRKVYVLGFGVLTLVVVLAFLWVYFYVHETKGLTNVQV